MGGFSVVLREPTVSQILTPLSLSVVASGGLPVVTTAGGPFTSVETDTSLPTIEAGYSFSFGPAAISLGGGYASYDVSGVSGTTEKEYGVDSWAVGLTFKLGFGPLYVNGGVLTGENPANFGLAQDANIQADGAVYNSTTDSVEDAETLMYYALVGFAVSDMLKLEAGYGTVANEIDVGTTTTEHETNAWYLQASINPVKNVFIIPEIGVVDYNELEVTGTADTDLGDVTYFGVKWQINW
jgi:hypothetical protein